MLLVHPVPVGEVTYTHTHTHTDAPWHSLTHRPQVHTKADLAMTWLIILHPLLHGSV